LLNLTRKLADFTFNTTYQDIPAEVVWQIKRLLLDSIGCAIAGLSTEKGKISLEFSKRLKGNTESTIIGTPNKVPSNLAAFANGELFNALDYEALTSPSGHISPFVMAAPLALAEAIRASGQELITALALSHEIGIRVARGLIPGKEFFMRIPQKGITIGLPTHGYGSAIFGGVAGAAKILGFNPDKLCHALGIAGYMCPIPVVMKFAATVPSSMSKYLSAGWISMTEVMAVLLSDLGYTGDKEILDGEFGFWKSFASEDWLPEEVIVHLGKNWFLPSSISYKAYPCCGAMHHALDCFYRILEENHLDASDIERIDILINMLADLPLWQNRRIGTHIEAQFSVAYVFSVAAHRIEIGPEWQDPKTFRNPKILKFMDKINFETYSDYQSAINKPIVKVLARERGSGERRVYTEGTIFMDQPGLNDHQLADKFLRNVLEVLTKDQAEKAIHTIFALEEIKDVSELLKLLRTES